MPYFQKKPIVIQAVQFDGTYESVSKMLTYFGMAFYDYVFLHTKAGYIRLGSGQNPDYIAIETLEGIMKAHPGDYIIKGVKGEFYPCREDIFEETYILVED